MKINTGPVFKGINNIVGNDDLRPALTYAIIENGSIVATDAHILVKVDLEIFGLDYQEKSLLEGKCIPKDTLQKLGAIKKNQEWFINDIGFNIGTSNMKTDIIYKVHRMDEDFNYPNYEDIFPKKTEKIDTICIDARILVAVQKVYQDATCSLDLKMSFHGQYKAVTLEDAEGKFLGLVMPRRLD